MFEADPFSAETTAKGEEVSDKISQEQNKSWHTLIESTDMTHNSKKAWSTIRKLRGDPTESPQQPNVTPNQVAHQLLLNGKSSKKSKKIKLDRKRYSSDPGSTSPFNMDELEAGIAKLHPGKAIGLDKISTEQLRSFGPAAKKWLLELYNHCLISHKFPKIWKKAHVMALLKPGKDSSSPKSYRPISLLSHTYKLFERLLLNRIAPAVDELLIPEQAGFRSGKSTTSQVLNLTQHIEDGFEKGLVTGAAFVDLSAAYDTVNHRCLLRKVLDLTKDIRLTELLEGMLANRMFFVQLGDKKSRWRRLKNGLPQGSVLAPLLFNIYTNDQPRTVGTCRYIYADDLGISAQDKEFTVVEERLSKALDELTPYYEENHLRANPSKTQVCVFHLRNREAKRQLNVTWSGTSLEHCDNPVYLGVTLDRTLSYKTHILKTKSKVCSRNSILNKLTGTRWGARPNTLRTTALALCYSCSEYACPVWGRSSHVKKLDPALNASCRLITGCLRPTPTDNLYILAGIAPPDIRRSVASMQERNRQVSDERHPMFGQRPAVKRLKSRESFLSTVQPLAVSKECKRVALWKDSLAADHITSIGIEPGEDLPPGADSSWAEWRCLNRLRTGIGRSKVSLQKWGYLEADQDIICECGIAPQTMQHLMVCPLLELPCTYKDLAEFNEVARRCTRLWLDHV